MPWGNGKITTCQPLASVSIATEGDVIAAPANTAKSIRVLGGELSGGQAGLYTFQESGSSTDAFAVYLEQNKNPVPLNLGKDGLKLTAGTSLQCDGPGSSTLSGVIWYVLE